MADIEHSANVSSRGRPQLRSDAETRQIIFEAARHEFAVAGYAGTSTEAVARRAGVSTKTLYRLIPTKAALFEGMISDRIERFVSDLDLNSEPDADIEAALTGVLVTLAESVLSPDVVGLQRIVLMEGGQFPDLAATFYEAGIKRSVGALASWLRTQVKRGLIKCDNAHEAAGMLIGMLVSIPQRAALFGGRPLLTLRAIKRRARTCTTLFLNGCRTD